ncbi:hypothetical protein PO909_025842 [Leuciscus waleckii]
MPKAQIITNFPGTASMKEMSGTSVVSRASSAVALAELSLQTTVETTAGGTITTSETKFKTPILPVTKKVETLETVKSTPGETVTACTQIIESIVEETWPNTAQKTPTPERIRVSDFKQTHKSETDVGIFGKPTEVGITVLKQESGTTSFAKTTTTANIKSAIPIPEPMTDGATRFITTYLKTSEKRATTQIRPAVTFKTAPFITETKAAPSTFIKRLQTTGKEPSKVETTTVRPQESTQAIKTLNGPTTINEVTGINLKTMIQTATGTKEKTVGKRLSRPTAGVITIKGRRGQVKTPMSHDKTLYSAITLGCILVICALLALFVFIKDFIGC